MLFVGRVQHAAIGLHVGGFPFVPAFERLGLGQGAAATAGPVPAGWSVSRCRKRASQPARREWAGRGGRRTEGKVVHGGHG